MSIKALNTISFKNIWLVSFPIILSNVAQNIVNVTDTAFLGHVGEIELGAAGNAGIFYFVMVMLGFGFSVGCQILIGRRNGEENCQRFSRLWINIRKLWTARVRHRGSRHCFCNF